MERELRRYQNILVCVGSGVITFGFWSLVKGVMSLFSFKDKWIQMVNDAAKTDAPADILMTALVISFGIVIAVDLAIRLVIGLSARKEGMGRDDRRHKGYLVLALISAAFSAFSMITDIQYFLGGLENLLDGIVTAIIDFTSLIMLLELFVAAIKVRKLKGKIAEAKAKEVPV